MVSSEPFSSLAGIKLNSLTGIENCILEIRIFVSICEALKNIIKEQNQYCLDAIVINEEMERTMLDATIIRHVLKDILFSEEYSIEGVANYTNTSEDVICDVLTGHNNTPSLYLSRKIIDLHMTVRKSLYQNIMKNIAEKYLAKDVSN